jgi:hypothetical protein
MLRLPSRMPGMPVLVAGMLLVTLSVDSAELVELVRLSTPQLRDRFDLPATCEPALSATRRGPRSSIEVRIGCVDDTELGRVPAGRPGPGG